MAYLDNPFRLHDYALCINDDFPIVAATDKTQILGSRISHQPKLGHVYVVDELLGEFLRFDEFDSTDPDSANYGLNWWFHTKFRPVTLEEEESTYHEEYAQEVSALVHLPDTLAKLKAA